MKLPDFLDDPDFNKLRTKMGAHELGHFELFDPARQLTWSEREALSLKGLTIDAGELRVLKDKTIAYKNSRIWVERDGVYHLAYCPVIQNVRHRAGQLKAGTFQWEKKKEGGVCLECLAVVQYQGFDARRLRRTEFSEQISEHFALQDFNKIYPFYPIV